MPLLMRILGIDFGLRNIGLAMADHDLVEPFGQLRFKNLRVALEKIQKILEEEKIEKIVLGISEGKMAEKTKEFAKQLEEKTHQPVFLVDESFSSREAREKMLEISKPQRKRRKQEHQVAACLLLENFIARMGEERRS